MNPKGKQPTMRGPEPTPKTWKRPGLGLVPSPGLIERDFRKDLGALNPLLCLADIALRRMAADLTTHHSESDKKRFIRASALRFCHPGLFADSEMFERSRTIAYITQLSFILSRLDRLCYILQRHPLVNPNNRDAAKGDFIRKTLSLILISRGELVANAFVDTKKHLNDSAFGVVDYHRRVRNIQLHDESLIAQPPSELLKIYYSLSVDSILELLGARPSLPNQTDSSDVLLCSKAVQRTARDLCRSLVAVELDIKPELVRRFGTNVGRRRQNAATAYLLQELLFDAAEVNKLLFEMSWLA